MPLYKAYRLRAFATTGPFRLATCPAIVGLAIVGLAIVVLTCGCLPDSFLITPISGRRALTEQVLYSDTLLPDGKIAIVDIEGVILNANTPGLLVEGEHPVSHLLEQLDKARRDRAVRAVVLRINSPGGSVTASELMHAEVARFRQANKPVVVMMLDVAASGGYYVACAANEIVACRSTITGSIGVLLQTFDATGTLAKIGIKADTIKSGEQKGAGSPFERMTPEQREVMQTIIDELYGQFVDVVADGRSGLSRSRVVELADGRVYTADQALDAGLIDSVGTMRDAIDRAKALAGIKTAKVVTYARPHGFAPNYYAQAPRAPLGDVNLLNVDLSSWHRSGLSPFMYLWTAP